MNFERTIEHLKGGIRTCDWLVDVYQSGIKKWDDGTIPHETLEQLQKGIKDANETRAEYEQVLKVLEALAKADTVAERITAMANKGDDILAAVVSILKRS